MSSLRNRARPSSSLEERLLKFAENARAAAKLIAPSRAQDELLSKAQKAETLADAADRLSTAALLHGSAHAGNQEDAAREPVWRLVVLLTDNL
jgi:hypothetical protein